MVPVDPSCDNYLLQASAFNAWIGIFSSEDYLGGFCVYYLAPLSHFCTSLNLHAVILGLSFTGWGKSPFETHRQRVADEIGSIAKSPACLM